MKLSLIFIQCLLVSMFKQTFKSFSPFQNIAFPSKEESFTLGSRTNKKKKGTPVVKFSGGKQKSIYIFCWFLLLNHIYAMII